MTHQAQGRVEILDILRLCAVLGVFFYHFGFLGPQSNGAAQIAVPAFANFAQYGFLGVPIFFIISGFVIAYSAEGRSATQFFIARFSRIYPTFLICMTITFLIVLLLGPPYFTVTITQWLSNFTIAATLLGEPYVDGAYWSLVIEVVFYSWIALFIAFGVFPRRLDIIVLVWLALSILNELTIDAVIFEKILIADDSGFFAVGLMIYEYYRGRRDARLFAMLALAVGTALFQAVHRLNWLSLQGNGAQDERVVMLIILSAIVIIFAATKVRGLPINSRMVAAIGGLTYPLYLLHMQAGYTIFKWSGPANAPLFVFGWLLFVTFVSLGIWRFIERPVSSWTKKELTKFFNLRFMRRFSNSKRPA